MPQAQQLRLLQGEGAGHSSSVGRGLNIIRQFVLAMHGTISVSVDPSSGTSISITLPTSAQAQSSG